MDLTPAELDLVYKIRMEDYESITIRTTSGKIEQLEVSKPIKNEKRIIDLLKEDNYQTIEIKQANRKIVHIKKTVKKKYDK